MPGEWKRGSWTYDAVGLGHTPVRIVNAIDTMLTNCGWVRPAWSVDAGNTTRHYVRTDALDILLFNTGFGASGNTTITAGGSGRISIVQTMTGGGLGSKANGVARINLANVFDGDTLVLDDGTNPATTFEFEGGVAQARGMVGFVAQPADGNTIVLNDGVNPALTFEFDSGGGVGGGNIAVTIGGSIAVTMANFITAVNAALLNITAAPGNPDSVTFLHDTGGVVGNVAITKTGANIQVIFGMTGGGGGVGVGGGNVSVAIGASVEDTIVNLVGAINTQASLDITAKHNEFWWFNGDVYYQRCGIRVHENSGSSRIEVDLFLEKAGRAGLQRGTNTAHRIDIVYSNLTANVFQFFAGEAGFFGECGRDGGKVNIAHWMIGTMLPVPELFGTDDGRRMQSCQGIPMDMFGLCKFSADRNYRHVNSFNGNKNVTANMRPFLVRGVNAGFGKIADDVRCGVIPFDNLLRQPAQTNESPGGYSFGITLTPRDGTYRISPMMVRQGLTSGGFTDMTVGDAINSASGANNVAASPSSFGYVLDIRSIRRMPRVASIDGTLIPFANVIDQSTGIEYYVTEMQDNGRVANLAVEWPATTVTIPATP